MKLFWKGVATLLFYVISGALLAYAASRSLDFITATLPADQQMIGYLGLAATSGGMIAWLLVFLYKAEGLGQKITAGVMVVVDMIGEFALFSFDSLYRTGQAGMTAALSPDEIRLVVIALSGLIAINILATVAFHLLDPENLRRMRESFVRDELEQNAFKEIEKRGEELARTMAPIIAKQWADDFEGRFEDMRSLGLGTLSEKKTALQLPNLFARKKDDQPGQTAEEIKAATEAAPVAVPLVGFGKNGNGHKGNA